MQIGMRVRMQVRMQFECVFWPQSRYGESTPDCASKAWRCFPCRGVTGASAVGAVDAVQSKNREQNGQGVQNANRDAAAIASADAVADAVRVCFLASIKMWRIHARLCVQSLAVFPLPRRYRRICRRCRRCRRVEKSRTKRKRSSKCKSGNTWGNAGCDFLETRETSGESNRDAADAHFPRSERTVRCNKVARR